MHFFSGQACPLLPIFPEFLLGCSLLNLLSPAEVSPSQSPLTVSSHKSCRFCSPGQPKISRQITALLAILFPFTTDGEFSLRKLQPPLVIWTPFPRVIRFFASRCPPFSPPHSIPPFFQTSRSFYLIFSLSPFALHSCSFLNPSHRVLLMSTPTNSWSTTYLCTLLPRCYPVTEPFPLTPHVYAV